MPIAPRSLSVALAALLTLGALAACGSEPTETLGSAAPNSQAVSSGSNGASPTVPQVTELGADRDPEASCPSTPAAVDEQGVTGGMRSVQTANGPVSVPADPQRVVVLDTDKLDIVCALGLQSRLVGAATPSADTNQPQYLGAVIEAVPAVGTLQEPDLEKIAALKPDLILGSAFRTQGFYANLSKIAPTAFTAEVGTPWKQNLVADGTALGRGAAAQAALDDYETRAADLEANLAGGATTASIVRFMGDKIRIYGPTSFSGSVLEDAGVARPVFQQLVGAKDRRFAEISEENIEQAAADVIYVSAYSEAGVERSRAALATPLWQTLPATQAGKTYIVSDETWMTGIGVIAANGLLADLEATLVQK
ncbi:iron-siderophore ABC transporter substrate-binding protein [Micrococcales bacterium 31B]|nr:iron-siderophore ABC transporter substrate-binding protein [Micrococcales bacterium 31B]